MGADSPQRTPSHANTATGARQNNKATLQPPQMDASVSPAAPLADAAALLALADAAPGLFMHALPHPQSADSCLPREMIQLPTPPYSGMLTCRSSGVCFMFLCSSPAGASGCCPCKSPAARGSSIGLRPVRAVREAPSQVQRAIATKPERRQDREGVPGLLRHLAGQEVCCL